MENYEEELNDFYNDSLKNDSDLKLIIDEFKNIEYDINSIETFDIKPVLSKEVGIKTIDIKKEIKNNKGLF